MMKRLLLVMVMAVLLTLASVAIASAAHRGTPGENQECNGILVAEQQIGDVPGYCD